MQPAPPPPPHGPQGQTGLALPLVVGGLALLLVIGVIVSAVLVASYLDGDDTVPVVAATRTPTPSPSPTPTPTPTPTAAPSPTRSIDPLHDECVIGTWRETSHQTDAEINGTKVRLNGAGAIQKFRPDGSLLLDYGRGVSRKGKAGGRNYEVYSKGTITYSWQTDRGQILYSNVKASGQTTWRINGGVTDREPLSGSLDPERYTCSGDSLRQFGPTWSIELVRVNNTGA